MREQRAGGPPGPADPDAPDAPGGGVATLEPPRIAPPARRRRYDPAWADWNPPRRWPGVLVTCVVLLAFAGIMFWHFKPHAHLAPRGPVLPKLVKVQHVYVPNAPSHVAVTTYRGHTNRTGLPFHSDGQLLVLNASCTCLFNFVVEFSTSLDQPISFPVNTSGHYDQVLNATVPAGNYTVSVVGDGPWAVQLVQPEPGMPAIATPFERFVSGDDVLGPFSSANTHLVFKFLSLTDGDVVVRLLNSAGTSLGSPFVGRFALSANRTLTKLPNPYFLEVDAAGYWDLKVHR